MIKEMINFVLVIFYSFVHYYYLAPIINQLFDNWIVSIGVWCLIVGIWGNLVGMRLVKAIYVSKDYRKENYFFVLLGIIFILVGIIGW